MLTKVEELKNTLKTNTDAKDKLVKNRVVYLAEYCFLVCVIRLLENAIYFEESKGE